MNYQDYLEEAKGAALILRSDILRDVLEDGNDLDDSIDNHVQQMADNLCTNTADVRDVVRALQDAHVLDDYSGLVYPQASRDEQNVFIAYEFWNTHIWVEVLDLFEPAGTELERLRELVPDTEPLRELLRIK